MYNKKTIMNTLITGEDLIGAVVYEAITFFQKSERFSLKKNGFRLAKTVLVNMASTVIDANTGELPVMAPGLTKKEHILIGLVAAKTNTVDGDKIKETPKNVLKAIVASKLTSTVADMVGVDM